MHYFATLKVGGQYLVGGKVFIIGEEQNVTPEEYNYLSSLTDSRLINEDSAPQIVKVPLFKFREVEATTEEKVLEDIQDAPDSLKPRRRKEAE